MDGMGIEHSCWSRQSFPKCRRGAADRLTGAGYSGRTNGNAPRSEHVEGCLPEGAAPSNRPSWGARSRLAGRVADAAPHEAKGIGQSVDYIEPIDLDTRSKAFAAWMPHPCSHLL
jgi:hypothetical protein